MNIFEARLRATLLASAAGFCLLAAPAIASDDPAADPVSTGRLDAGQAEREAQDERLRPLPDEVRIDPQIVIGHPGTPTTALDAPGVTGIGQMIADQGGGFIGLCTGTLINPRTVIFAAHCVNDQAATSYGANSGGTAIGFGFEQNLRANGAGQTDELVRWLFGTGANQAGRFQTNAAQSFYNANAVAYHPGSTEPAANSFLYADIALASLDTPAEGVPSWALLFSPLAQPSAITKDGTGYHVNIAGYGRFGTGATGSVNDSDFRRRVAENMLGALASINDFEGFIFGGNSGLPQNLYWLDFDDPRRGTAQADPRDFNAWRDNPQPREGLTAQGDSGGPLILDRTFARQVVIGTLSGGYTRFFTGAPANGYGTASFYQPLYLYWDWIAANNPYRYVGNVAGSRNWTDPANWVTLNDPSYQIIGPNGQLVTGVPSDLGEGKNGIGGKFGQSCIEGPVNAGFSDCRDVRTGQVTTTVRPIGTADNNTGSMDAADLAAQLYGREGVELEAQAQGTMALPAATIANGLPGATNFVPNNSNGNRTQGVLPRYFDVTLSASGTTTLDTAVTVDKFTLNGVGAGLTITSTGSLTSLMDVTQVIGTLHVDGTLSAPSDFFLMAGGLSGNGTISAPFTTSMAGVIAPGNAATVGTLTFRGNLILASGTGYMVNLGANGTSDRIVVTANGTSTGSANLGGQIALTWTPALRANDSFTILTAAGGITGAFQNPAAISAILTPRLSYSANAVTLTIQAGSYANVVSPADPIAYNYALLLDRNRGQASVSALYGPLDLQNAATIVSTLNGLAPANQANADAMSVASVDTTAGFLRDRLETLDPSDMGGRVASYGRPTQVASLGLSSLAGFGEIKSDLGTPLIQEGRLPEDMSAFVAGGFIDGTSRGIAGIGGRDVFDGWFLAAGIEKALDDTSLIGVSMAYNELSGRGGVMPNQLAESDVFQVSLYGKAGIGEDVTLDARIAGGRLNVRTERTVSFLGTPYTLEAGDKALVLDSEVGVSSKIEAGALDIKPRLSARSTLIGLGDMTETGGAPALRYHRHSVRSLEGRGGFTIEHHGERLKPYAAATFVHEFNDHPGSLTSNFASATGAPVNFVLRSEDRNWFEVGGGLTLKTGAVDLSISADSTVDRDNLSVQTYRGSVSFRF